MITLQDVTRGYETGAITLSYSGFAEGVVCYIGDFWFLFGGIAADNASSVEDYTSSVSKEEIIGAIYDALTTMSQDATTLDEYRYYECYLNETLQCQNSIVNNR